MSKEQENISPTPPIREKESTTSTGIPIPAVIDVHTPPTLELALDFARQRLHFHDDAFIVEWHRQMSEVYFWTHPQTGQALRHWPAYLKGWIRQHYENQQKAKRQKVHGGKASPNRKPDNYLAPVKEESDVNPF